MTLKFIHYNIYIIPQKLIYVQSKIARWYPKKLISIPKRHSLSQLKFPILISHKTPKLAHVLKEK